MVNCIINQISFNGQLVSELNCLELTAWQKKEIDEYCWLLEEKMTKWVENCRPNVEQVLSDEFMTCGYIPTRLPLSCLTMAPRFDAKLNSSIIAVRRPLGEVNRETKASGTEGNRKWKAFGWIFPIFLISLT